MAAAFGSRGAGFGLDAELARKQAAKYDHNGEALVKQWMTAVTGEAFGPTFGDSLKDGRMLCALINIIRPTSVKKIETSAMPFKQMENISNFLKACRLVGVAEYDLFETVDLFEQKDMGVVVACIMALGRKAKTAPGFAGPHIGGGGAPAPQVDIHAHVDMTAAASNDPITSATKASPSQLSAKPIATPAKPPPPPPPARPPVPSPAPPPTTPVPTTVFRAPAVAAGAVIAPAPSPVTSAPATGRTNTTKGPLYGLDAELQKKMQLQHDPALEADAVQWISTVTGRTKTSTEDLGAWLHDGTVLCELVNAIRPGSVKKINNSTMPFKQMENITAFLRCCRSSLAVPEPDLFETVDLFEEKNMNFVVRCIFSLGRSIQTLNPPYTGPVLSNVRR